VSRNRSVEERADRWLRRYTGPWQTLNAEIGPVQLAWRRRYRPKVEWVRLWVAWHDLAVHDIGRGLLLPILRRLSK
jgi:hypothetical protein